MTPPRLRNRRLPSPNGSEPSPNVGGGDNGAVVNGSGPGSNGSTETALDRMGTATGELLGVESSRRASTMTSLRPSGLKRHRRGGVRLRYRAIYPHRLARTIEERDRRG